VPPVAKLDLRNAYARNVFYDVGKSFGVFEPSGRWHATLPAFRDALESYQPLAATFTIYIDGKQDASGPGLGADASLANDANLYVGGTPRVTTWTGRSSSCVSLAAHWPTRRRRSMNSTRGSSTGRSFTTSPAARALTMAEKPAP
jgi:hypothetical protein